MIKLYSFLEFIPDGYNFYWNLKSILYLWCHLLNEHSQHHIFQKKIIYFQIFIKNCTNNLYVISDINPIIDHVFHVITQNISITQTWILKRFRHFRCFNAILLCFKFHINYQLAHIVTVLIANNLSFLCNRYNYHFTINVVIPSWWKDTWFSTAHIHSFICPIWYLAKTKCEPWKVWQEKNGQGAVLVQRNYT